MAFIAALIPFCAVVFGQVALGFIAPQSLCQTTGISRSQQLTTARRFATIKEHPSYMSNANGSSSTPPPPSPDAALKKRSLPRRVVRLYTDYASRLWRDTNPEARQSIANDQVANVLRQAHQILQNPDALNRIPEPQRTDFVKACDSVLKVMDVATSRNKQESQTAADDPLPDENTAANGNAGSSAIQANAILTKPKRNRRSIGFGALMGLVVACWVFSGNYIFTGLFTLMTILGQLEYYRMVMNTGIYPARRISILGACSMFLTALFTPDLHQICLPVSGLWAMVWFLTFKRTVTTIPEIATTFTGMFYLGYVPSFWVRIRMIGMGREPTRLAPITQPMLQFLAAKGQTLPSFIPSAVHLPITTGAIFIFWSWLCLAFSDVGAYFVGRKFGKTKLGAVAPAAGATSPNKTVEGVIGGCAASAVLAIFGAWVQRWPWPMLTGSVHGILLGLLGLLGDLTASMLKRDAGLKDFGDLLPEHGGILDRVDSFIWSAPYS
jgi:phosphatidate cytidylyltransferase